MRHLAVAVYVRGVDPGLLAQERHELGQRGHLPGGRRPAVKVADQADPDAAGVEEIVRAVYAEVAPWAGLAVRPRVLALPARPDEDFSVRVAHAVADDEMVAQPARPFAHVAMKMVHARRRIADRGRVVHHDDLPAVPLNSARRNEFGRVEHRRHSRRRLDHRRRRGRRWRWNRQRGRRLARTQDRIRQRAIGTWRRRLAPGGQKCCDGAAPRNPLHGALLGGRGGPCFDKPMARIYHLRQNGPDRFAPVAPQADRLQRRNTGAQTVRIRHGVRQFRARRRRR